jgi:hypothetical protein
MSTTYEGGHAKNLASLQKLIQLCTDIGVPYNPVPADIKITGLTALFTSTDAAHTSVKTNYNDWKNATNSRELAFKPLPALTTQLLSILQSSTSVQQTIDDFVTLAHKMRGESSKLTKADASVQSARSTNTNAVVEPVPDPSPTKSNSQRSFDNMIEHFDKMVKLLASVPAYNPNENPLKVATLTAQLASLKTLNNAANDAYYKLSLARIARNKAFYAADTGMLDVARRVKSYVKGKFGASSQEYKAIVKIKFVRVITVKKAK